MRITKAITLLTLFTVSLIPQQAESGNQSWGNDVLVHQANRVYGFGLDQTDKDTLILVVSDSSTSNLKDTLYVYRSTDDGQIWNNLTRIFPATDNLRHGKADVISAKLCLPVLNPRHRCI